jgi:DnaK suppressor protein
MALDIEKYKDRLLKERAELIKELGGVAEEGLQVPADSENDVIEVAQSGPIIDVEAGVFDLKTHRLDRIDEALRSIEEGTYGTCAKCGKPIELQRLDADPAALLCIKDATAEDANFVAPAM